MSESRWLAIESAPKDRQVLLFSRHLGSAVIGRWDDQRHHNKPRPYWEYGWMGVTWARDNPPTHWQPLPDPPEGA